MQTAYVVNKGTVLDVCGPTVEFLNSPEETDAVYCIMIGTIPPGVSVPLHSHPDVESFSRFPEPFRCSFRERTVSNGSM